MNDKLKEIIYIFASVIIFIGLGMHLGIFNNFSSDVLEKSFGQLSSDVSGIKTGDLFTNSVKKTKNYAKKYKNYQPSVIPKAVIDGANSSSTFLGLLHSNKKVIFYVYDENDKFDTVIRYFLNIDGNSDYYYYGGYSRNAFKSIRAAANWGTDKICNTIEECNQVRLKASNYSMLSEFFNRCGNTLCIINPSKNQYYRMRNRNPQNALTVLKDMKFW